MQDVPINQGFPLSLKYRTRKSNAVTLLNSSNGLLRAVP